MVTEGGARLLIGPKSKIRNSNVTVPQSFQDVWERPGLGTSLSNTMAERREEEPRPPGPTTEKKDPPNSSTEGRDLLYPVSLLRSPIKIQG